MTTLEAPAPAELKPRSELELTNTWDTDALRRLTNRKTADGRKPAFLFLGAREADLLREHLGAAFGPESVRTLKNLYYMGLEVVELEVESYFRTAGIKRVEGLKEALNRNPGWKDIEASRFWRFSVL